MTIASQVLRDGAFQRRTEATRLRGYAGELLEQAQKHLEVARALDGEAAACMTAAEAVDAQPTSSTAGQDHKSAGGIRLSA